MKIKTSIPKPLKKGGYNFNLGLGDFTKDDEVFVHAMRITSGGKLLSPGLQVGKAWRTTALFGGKTVDKIVAELTNNDLMAPYGPITGAESCVFGDSDNALFFGDTSEQAYLKAKNQALEQENIALRRQMEEITKLAHKMPIAAPFMHDSEVEDLVHA